MNMPVLKTEPGIALPKAAAATTAAVIPLKLAKPGFVQGKLVPALGQLAVQVVPPIITIGLLLAVWQVLCDRPGATLPAPTKIWSEAYDLIVDPFFVAGPQDIGLGWRVLTSLQRVAIGYGFAALIGIAQIVTRGTAAS